MSESVKKQLLKNKGRNDRKAVRSLQNSKAQDGLAGITEEHPYTHQQMSGEHTPR